MRKFILVFFMVLSAQIWAQLGVTEFPKIGYTDLYWLGEDHSDSNYYYHKLSELGLTHTVTKANSTTLNNGYGIKIIDYRFNQQSDKYAKSSGNHPDNYAYQIGANNGAHASIWTKSEEFGFGTEERRARWANPDSSTTGDLRYLDQTQNIYVAYASKTQHNSGILVYLQPPRNHQKLNGEYNIHMIAKADYEAGDQSVVVARVRIYEDVGTTSSSLYISPNETLANQIEEQALSKSSSAPTVPIDSTFELKASDFGTTNSYIDINVGSVLRKKQYGVPFKITVEWLDTRNLYIDQIYIYKNHYYDMLVADAATIEAKKTEIRIHLDDVYGSESDHPNYEHPYLDEPDPITYRSYKFVNELAQEYSVLNNYICGATNALTDYEFAWTTHEFRPKYLLYDLYPIYNKFTTISSGNHNIQNAYDTLIALPAGTLDNIPAYRGLRAGIEAAQKYTPNDYTDDVPFFHTIQVHAGHKIKNGAIIKRDRRAPTASEILAQGNLAICYGVKGIMYFLVYTDAPHSSGEKYAYYGLFDEINNAYNGATTGITQNPAAQQVPNSRYYAVQALNQHIDNISSTLLNLNWKEAYSIHNTQPSGENISSVNSYSGTTADALTSTFVELGFFEHKTNSSEYFYVVNRRSLPSETRDIKLTLNKSGSSHSLISEVGTDNIWIVSNTGNFTASFQPGEGKLFKIENFFDGNEILSGNKNLQNSPSIPSGRTLTITAGSYLTIENGSSLNVYGGLIVSGTSSNRVTVDGGSGIKAYYGSNVNINYAEIKNATYGVYVDNASPTITNCLIQNNSFGMLVQNYGSPTLSYNTIRNNTMEGIYCISHGHADLFPGHNLITNNGSGGIFLNYQSSSYAGYSSGPGFNSIYGNTSYEFEAKVVSNANLKTVYWGTGSAPVSSEYSVDGGSSYTFADYFSNDPGAGSSLSKSSGEVADFDLANALYAKGDYKEAEKLYKKVIKENGKETISQFALEGLNRCYIKEKKKGIKDYLKTELTSKYKTSKDEFELQTLELDAFWSLQEGDVETALKTYDYILENFSSDKDIVEMTLYNKGKAYIDYLGDKENATNVFAELKERDSKGILAALCDEALKGDSKLNTGSFLEKEDEIEFEDETVVSSFELFENYPNPFNPTTTISYQLPEAGFVTLKVYDMLGKEVANLVEGRNDAGKYNVNFDASNLASGIYVYRITVQSFEGSQKNFTKSAKMLLLK